MALPRISAIIAGDLPLSRHQSSKSHLSIAANTMLTKYLTGVTASFSPFNARSGKTARNFLALLPPNARSTMSIDVKMLGREGANVPASLGLKFST